MATSTHPYRTAWETRDLDRWGDALAADVVLHAPLVSAPFRGRSEAVELFEVLFGALDDLEITMESSSGESHVFCWRARANGRVIEGADVIRHDPTGAICEIRVLIRPLVGIAAFAAAVGPPLAARRGRARGAVVRLMSVPLTLLLTVADVLASRLIGLR